MRARRALVPVLVAALVPIATATAQAPGPSALVDGTGGTARCLRATGAPGQLLLQAPEDRGYATDLRDGLDVTETLQLGRQVGCAEGASGGGRLVVAAPVTVDGTTAIRVVTRPGGDPVTLALPKGRFVSALQVVAGPDGSAAVGWLETRLTRRGLPTRIRVARAAPGAAPDAPVTVGAPTSDPGSLAHGSSSFDLAVAPDGAVLAALSKPSARRPRTTDGLQSFGRLSLLRAEAGAPFGPAAVLGRGSAPDLDVAADGSTLLTAADGGAAEVWAGPADGSLKPVAVVRGAPAAGTKVPPELEVPSYAGDPAVAAAPGGSGVLVFRTGFQDLGAVVLDAGSRPRRPQVRPGPAAPPEPASGGDSASVGVGDTPAPFRIIEEASTRPALLLAPDGRFVAGLPGEVEGRPSPTLAASGSLAAGMGPLRRLASPTRATTGLVATPGPDGTPAIAVADEASSPFTFSKRPFGVLTLSAPSPTPAASASAPAASVVLPRALSVGKGEPVRVEVRCAAACDARVDARAPVTARTGDRLRAAGHAVFSVFVGDSKRGSGIERARVRVLVSAPGGLATRTLTRTVVVRHRPGLRPPRLTQVQVRRRGDEVRVTFHAAPVPPGYRFLLYGLSRRRSVEPVFARARRVGGDRYAARLTLPAAPRALQLFGASDLSPGVGFVQRKLRLPPA